jgi:hypothetical protein
MFGYVTCDKAELKMKDWERYNAYYCGVCKSIGARFGQIPRMILTFDAAFIAVLLAGLTDEEAAGGPSGSGGYSLRSERCIAHPLKEKLVVREEAVDYAADVMLLLAYYKMEDDRQDEHSLKAASAERYLRGAKSRIEKQRPGLGEVLAAQLARQSALEAQKCASCDQAADPTGKIMEAVFCEGLKAVRGEPAGEQEVRRTDAQLRVLTQLGYQLGRWIYLIDAADDLGEDIAKGGYNPFKERFLYDPASETKEDFSKRVHDDAERILLSCLADMADCLDLLEIRRHTDIIKNVVQFGLLRQTDTVLEKLAGAAPHAANERKD